MWARRAPNNQKTAVSGPGSGGGCVLLVAAHAASDGTDNRALVTACNEVRF
jgi:hypothetical protein